MNFKSFTALLTLTLSLSYGGAFTTAADWKKAHGHTGRLSPFEPSSHLNSMTNLDNAALNVLKSGKTYKTSQDVIPGTGLKRVVVVQDVQAPADVVLGRILDYDNYSKMAPQTLESETYQRTSDPTHDTYFSRLKTGMRGFALEFFVKAKHFPQHNSVTWTLDYSKQSDIEDACGHWNVIPHPDSPQSKSRVFYSVDMIMGPSVPGFVASFINKKAATDAAAWVKKFSEQA